MKQTTSILIVDDDVAVLKIISKILQRNSYKTDIAVNGEEALNKIRNYDYDLVLLDIHLNHKMDGFEVTREIQTINNELPVILITADHGDEVINKGFSLGASDFLKKPLSTVELLARIKKTLELKRTEKRSIQLIMDLSKDIETASKIQISMLPKWIYLDDNIIFSSHYEPYEAVGGDLFDRIKLDEDRYVVYLGDISGHGVQAALLMTAIKSIIKIMVENNKENFDLPWLATRLNERLCNELFLFDNYLTLLIGIVDLKTNEFQFLNAGHPPFVIIDTVSGKSQAIESSGSLPLGWMHNLTYSNEDLGTIPITEHNIILLFSDGIYECLDSRGEQFGIKGILNALQEYIQVESCISIPFRIKQHLLDNNYNISSDDFTLFAFQKRKHDEHSVSMTESKESKSIHFLTTLRAALREVGKTAQQCEKIVLDWTNNNELGAKVELIIDEFLNNIVKYGYNYTEDAAIVVEFNIHSDQLAIKFWDKGIEWTPEEDRYSVENPYDFENDVYQVDGKGVNIIMSMSNKFHRVRYGPLNETIVVIDM